jgi:hypothetical protein
MLQLPFYISLVFIPATFYSVFMFWKATGFSKTSIIVISLWMLLQGIAGYSLFYTHTKGLPPRFLLLIGPALIAIIVLFTTGKGRAYLDKLHTPSLILMNVVRIPVELVLYWLFVQKTVPQVMTFEGNNLDILSGLTAPLIWYLTRRQQNGRLLLAWNIICLALLVNIVTRAVLAAPFQFQQIAFDQPNTGVLYFPFVWLPGVIVPLVLLGHLVMIRKLVYRKKSAAAMALGTGN